MADIVLNGVNRVVKQQIARLPEKLKEAGLEIIEEIADETVFNAKVLVRVDTGSLQKSIRKEKAGDNVRVRAGGFVVNPRSGRPVDYAAIIEQRYPFMRPALHRALINASERIKTRVLQKANEP